MSYGTAVLDFKVLIKRRGQQSLDDQNQVLGRLGRSGGIGRHDICCQILGSR